MTYQFHPDAEREFLLAIDYYEHCEPDLGYEFALEVYSTIQNILQYPLAWPIMDRKIRRCQTSRFPFGVIYSYQRSRVIILAVMHLHREPGYWKSRIPAGGN